MMVNPSFERPPVIETVIGVQFDVLPSLKNAHLGAFWKQLGVGWASVEEIPALPQEFERFGDERAWVIPALNIKLAQVVPTRMQIRNAERNRMIQVQNGRFHYNWLGKSGESYARYPVVQSEFQDCWSRFARFVESESLGDLKLNQWEITYVNHLPKGTVWETPSDWQRVFRGGVGVALPTTEQTVFESMSGEWHYEISPRRGRLHIELQHGRRGSANGEELLILKLTARGPLDSVANGLQSGLQLGHDTIVGSFHALASDKARAYWKELQ